jgi:ectoine hydroxylase-related dioxygenase (phytanoyl-CoA dioxygenase family)
LRTAQEKNSGLHRDVKQWSRTIFTVIFYLEETNLDNGCTQIVPGTHHLPGIGTSLYPYPCPKAGCWSSTACSFMAQATTKHPTRV